MKADHAKIKRQLAIARGQIEGIIKMIDDDAYCLDVSDQIMAVMAVLKRANNKIIAAHLRSCVLESKSDDDAEKKLQEMEYILKRLSNDQ